MKRILKWLGIGLAALIVLVAVVAGLGYGYLRYSAPSAWGSLAIPGLSAPVEVVRDKEGVPHIFATTTDDLYMALGFVHAQDRLWQMELQRRTGQGRLSEIFGERTYKTDVFLRTLDLYGHAERSLGGLPAEVRKALEAYARGVNAYLKRPVGLLELRLPPEFLLLQHEPEPWRAADSAVIAKLMALQLSMNLKQELLRLTLAGQGLSVAEIEDLLPTDHAGQTPPPLPDIATLYPLKRAPVRKAEALDLPGGPLDHLIGALVGMGASNNWVVAGARTKSGKPLLANDPHLHLEAPSVWYLVHLALQGPGKETHNVVGASVPGMPNIVLGRSDRIAWGFTNAGADAQDVFIEKMNPDNPKEYLTPDGWRPFVAEEMVIAVRGGGTRKVTRLSTRHGPVLPGFYYNLEGVLAEGHVAALKWTALSDDDTTLAAGMLDPKIRTVADYMDAMHLFVVPMQSMVVADVDGAIGLIAPGRVPVRDPKNASAGRVPVPGWEETYDWKGYLKVEDLPRELDALAFGTANARMVGPDYPHHLTFDWDASFRQQRIKELIFDKEEHDMASMASAQMDVVSRAIARLQPLMIAAAQGAASVDQAVLDSLTTWDGAMRADRPEPLIFTAWMREAVKVVYADDLGPVLGRYLDYRAMALIRLLEGRATGRDWCDDRTTPERETCATAMATALDRALRDLEERYGKDRSRWRWGKAHRAVSEHRPFGSIELLGLSRFFNVEVETPGGNYTLNRGRTDLASERPFANTHAAGFRAIYDLGDLDRSLFIQSTGQSGNPFSTFYRSFARRWAEGKYIEIPTKRDAIAKTLLGTWTLTPPR